MKIDFIHAPLESLTADLLLVPVVQGTGIHSALIAKLDKKLGGLLHATLMSGMMDGKTSERVFLPGGNRCSVKVLGVVGMGLSPAGDVDALRRSGAQLMKTVRERKVKHAVIVFPWKVTKQSARIAAQAFVEGLCLAAHRFHKYKSGRHGQDHLETEIEDIRVVWGDRQTLRAAREGAERGMKFAEATNLARDLVNTPSSDMTPRHLADVARMLAAPGTGIECTVLEQEDMERMKMHAALAVARGSMHPPVGVHLTYAPPGAKKTVAIVGKAVTFDSGGLSLKSSDGMMTMKIDMAGAATVLGLFALLPVIKPKVKIHGIFLGVENMPSGSAYRPGDVVEAMDGTTIEILNTDAEGRVTLADALSYARGLKPDTIIDLATLTGACITALGEDVAGLLTTDDRLADAFTRHGKITGEMVWRLPLYAPYAEFVKSKIADIRNIGGGHGAGTITAALFLKHFVGKIPWAHLDIAGPSYNERETRPDQPHGASGYGVRMLAAYLESL